MNRIDRLFANKSRDILNIYFTAGYPNLEDTGPIIQALSDTGVDLIEIGMPYSDPLADGPTIQQSGQQAIANGMTLDKLFEQVTTARQSTAVPLILMGYYNQVMQYGPERFIQRAKEAGIDGLILPDLPVYEYEREMKKWVEAADLGYSFLITPQTSVDRIRQIDALTSGFIYMVSSASITGSKQGISDAQLAYFERIDAMQLTHPRLIGFGISDRETFSTASRYAQGAIIGSAFIRALGESRDLSATITEFVNAIRPETVEA